MNTVKRYEQQTGVLTHGVKTHISAGTSNSNDQNMEMFKFIYTVKSLIQGTPNPKT